MTDAFERAFAFVIEEEGGLVNIADDKGGRTKYGISHRSYPSVNLDTLTIEGAKQLYYRDYFRVVRGDVLPWPLSLILFDWAVHSGTVTAILALQRILGCHIDGKFGPETKASALAAHQQQLVEELIEERLESMIVIALGDPSQAKFLKGGWKNRIVRLAMLAGKEF